MSPNKEKNRDVKYIPIGQALCVCWEDGSVECCSRKDSFKLHYKSQNELVKLENLCLLRLWVENLRVLTQNLTTRRKLLSFQSALFNVRFQGALAFTLESTSCSFSPSDRSRNKTTLRNEVTIPRYLGKMAYIKASKIILLLFKIQEVNHQELILKQCYVCCEM